MITTTKEDYLRAVYYLGQQNQKVKVTDLAKYMNLAKSTVSERIKNLSKDNLIKTAPYTSLKFTKKGRSLAEKLTYKHRVIEVFLHDLLKMSKDVIHQEAHLLEHAFSDEAISKLSNLLGNPKKDPHGKSIPNFY